MSLPMSPLGFVHTVISLVALASGFAAFIRYREISPETRAGRLYVITTILTCVTGFFIFHHGGFNKAHVLGIITLVVLGMAAAVKRTRTLGGASPYVAVVGYSATYLFHWIPTLTETSTRLPVGAPLLTDPDSPALQKAIGVCFVLFLIGAMLQVKSLRARLKAAATTL